LSLIEIIFDDMMEQKSTAAATIADGPTFAEQGRGKGKFLPVTVTVEPEYTEEAEDICEVRY
jgi:hypothetical protein